MDRSNILRFILASVVFDVMKKNTIIGITRLETEWVEEFPADVTMCGMNVSKPSQPLTKTISLGV